MIKRHLAIITAILLHAAVAIITFPYYWFFKMPNGKSWSAHISEVLNIEL